MQILVNFGENMVAMVTKFEFVILFLSYFVYLIKNFISCKFDENLTNISGFML
jgi:hypothetical protein